MCLSRFLDRKIETMLPGEEVTYTREQLEALVADHGNCDSSGSAENGGEPERAESVFSAAGRGASTEQIGRHFGVSQSTARDWCSSGFFGEPELLKPNGRDWEVPWEKVRDAEDRRREGWRFRDRMWIEPGGVRSGVKKPSRSRRRNEGSARRREQRGREPTGDVSVEPKQHVLQKDYSGWQDAIA